MASRVEELQELLENILESNHVYFQPPPSVKINYPAIIYSLDDIDNKRANNILYRTKRKYLITLIDLDPDSEFIDKLNELPMCSFDRTYKSDNLNHFVFSLYF